MLKQLNIIGMGSLNGITTIHTTNHKYDRSERLYRYVLRLNTTFFIRFHRSYIIYKNDIKEVQLWFNYTFIVILTNGVKMHVGRSFMTDF
ncbi:LytTR family transcriptional regulator DNA-binding domain-containing protein, partial [Staphylococcus aureus]|nr:LytTR family transcriptional regulator DNA-binding domain-containing protein [Staphylococcus aureus]